MDKHPLAYRLVEDTISLPFPMITTFCNAVLLMLLENASLFLCCVCDFKIRCYACIVHDFIFLVDLSNSCILMLNSTLFSSVNVEDETKENSI